MDIQISEHIIRVQVVTLKGRFDAFSAPELRQSLQNLQNAGEKYFVLDLRELSFMDSAGMAVLVSLLKGARTAGGAVTLVKPTNENALRILLLTKFDRVFRLMDDVQSAVREVLV